MLSAKREKNSDVSRCWRHAALCSQILHKFLTHCFAVSNDPTCQIAPSPSFASPLLVGRLLYQTSQSQILLDDNVVNSGHDESNLMNGQYILSCHCVS